ILRVVQHAERFETEKDLSDADHWMMRLLTNPLCYNPQFAAQTVEAQVALLHAQDLLSSEPPRMKEQKRQDAAKAIADFLRLPGIKKEAAEEVAARLYELMGDLERAKQLYQRLATSQEPQRVMLLARFLGKHGETDEALNLCEQLWTRF